ncbi:MAG: PfkB family carbohydrate kinase [Pseudomonadota bacterium]
MKNLKEKNISLVAKNQTTKDEESRKKIASISELSEIVKSIKQSGKTVIQAHGTFDLVHLGHVKHLEAAKSHADVLIVTLTADSYVNKGPNRPVFNEQLRAEMLAALQVVDYVAINYNLDAVPAISAIKANFYAKGQDYLNPEGDITGKITEERKAIEAIGGQIIFTEEIMFSSTELINRNFNIYEPHLHSHINGLRENDGLEALTNMIDSIKDMKILIVGDAIIDDYQYVIPMAKASKENIIATRYQDCEQFAGGVFATANHVASFCKEVEIITCLGGRNDYKEFIKSHLKPNVKLTVITRQDSPTICKRRFVDPSYMRKLFEVYYMDDEPLMRDLEDEFNALIDSRISNYDVVISNDFGHGLIGRSTVELLCSKAKFLAVNTQSNSANIGYNLVHKYPRADYACIDAPEARLAVTDKISPIEDVISKYLPQKINCSKFIVTHGKHGCVTHERGDVVHTIPAVAKSVVDTVGAGDAFLAVTAPLVATGAPLNQIGFIGNIVGALKVAIIGHQESVEKVNVLKSIKALLK